MSNEPYVAVIFTSRRTPYDDAGYDEMAERMRRVAAQQPGYVGFESVHDASGAGISVSYWADDEAARTWKANAEHLVAQAAGRTRWYDSYRVRVATVEREYAFERAIFHMALPGDWRAAEASGTYAMSTRGMTVADEGFMHCSFAHQMRDVAERYYGDVDEVVILHLDRDRIGRDLRVEPPAEGIDELFPHVYRAIDTDEVVTTTEWRRGDDGWGDPPVVE
jgi:uncharacterized protein (DUF952 family)/heme-degrading monooxygenase HmoA